MNKLSNSMKTAANRTARTENGAVSLHSSNNACVDFFSKSGACRGNEGYARSLFRDAFAENKETALRSLFYTRDIRGGQGERDVFKACLLELGTLDRGNARQNLLNVAEYGRWDDLYIFMGTSLESDVIEIVRLQLEKDCGTETPSLLAKWMPSENASSKTTKALGAKFRTALDLSPREYRKLLSGLRAKIGLVEQAISKGDFSSIEYGKIPSKAGFKYRKAFGAKDTARYEKFLSDVSNGEATINTGTLYPYDITRGLYNGCDWYPSYKGETSLEVMWDNLPNYLEGNEHNGLVMADVSGSMIGSPSKGSSSDPIQVAVSLALYIAERNEGAFKNLFMTFDTNPSIVDCSKGTLAEKLNKIAKAPWGGSTNVEAAFKKILQLAVKNEVPQAEMPEVLYIISDMQFNSASRTKTNFEVVKKNFEHYGYELPKLVFWNVRAGLDQPISHDEANTALVSGCTPNVFKSVLSGSTPEDVMNKAVYDERYDAVVV